MMNIMDENIKQNQQTLDTNDPRDFIDKFLIDIQETADEKSSFYID